jgi:hypothetical protein
LQEDSRLLGSVEVKLSGAGFSSLRASLYVFCQRDSWRLQELTFLDRGGGHLRLLHAPQQRIDSFILEERGTRVCCYSVASRHAIETR